MVLKRKDCCFTCSFLGEPPLKLEMHPIRRRYKRLHLSAEEQRYFDDHYLMLWDLVAAADYLNVSRLYYATCMVLYSNAQSHCRKTWSLIQAMRLSTLGKEASFCKEIRDSLN